MPISTYVRLNAPDPTAFISPGDIEEARIRRALDLAKLLQLQNEPRFQQQQLALTQRGQDITQRGQDLEAATATRGQDITARGQDLALQEARERNKSIFLSDLLQTAGAHGADYHVLADAAARAGVPEYQQALQAHEVQQQDTQFQQLLLGYQNEAKKGPKQAQKFLDALDPVNKAQLQSHLNIQSQIDDLNRPAAVATPTPTPLSAAFTPQNAPLGYSSPQDIAALTSGIGAFLRRILNSQGQSPLYK